MLWRVVKDDERNWDLLLPYILFTVRETPQASTSFTAFELLLGRRPWGLLDMACKAWEEQPSLFWTVAEYVREMQERINKVTAIVKQHMQETHATQC